MWMRLCEQLERRLGRWGMYQDQYFAINRRNFPASSVAAAAGIDVIITATDQLPERSSYTIPPVQLWDSRTNTFSPYFSIGWHSLGPSARIAEIAKNGANTVLFAGMGLES